LTRDIADGSAKGLHLLVSTQGNISDLARGKPAFAFDFGIDPTSNELASNAFVGSARRRTMSTLSV
jgi:hypothetical protein